MNRGGAFRPAWDSLSKNALPEWLLDAKFGVYTHWGVYSVPAHRGRDMPLDVKPWFLFTGAIACPWYYVNDKKYRDGAGDHVKSLIDLLSRSGILPLSLTPKGNGSIPEEEQVIMRGIGSWLKVNDEAICGTRLESDPRRAGGDDDVQRC
ncbi:MAG: alpha-L-fucosidase [Phycisphaerales bacterium]|nr:MAG: alpha-L-fucosidase [Phycisphaerales bacterium]